VKLLLFFLLWPTYGYFYQSAGHNEAARLDQARAMVEDGVLWVDAYSHNSADLIAHERDGAVHVYSGKAPGTSLVAAVPLKLWSLAFRMFGLPEWIHWHLVVYLTTIFSISLLSALAAVVVFDVVWRLTRDLAASLASVVAVWLGSILFPFSTLVFGHALAASLVAFAFAILVRLRHEGLGSFRRPRLALAAAGLSAGFAMVTEYPTALLVAPLGLYFLYGLSNLTAIRRVRLDLLASFAAGGLIAGAVLAAYNLAAFGMLYYVPYQAYLQGPEAAMFPAHAKGFLGIHWPGTEGFLNVLAEITLRPQRGLLYLSIERWRVYALSPVLWLAVPGLVALFARRDTRPEAILVTAAIFGLLSFNACFGDSIVYWGGGASVGPRHLIPMLPLLALPLALTLRRLWWLFYPLLLVSVFYVLLATAVEPRVGYEFRNPPRDLFVSNYMAGRFALTRSALFDTSQRLLTEDSVAFNLGKMARLPGAWQLAPLMAWWCALGGLLLRRAGVRPGTVSVGAGGAARSAPRTPLDRLLPPHPSRPALGIALLAAFAVFVVVTPSVDALRTAPRRGQQGLVGEYYPNSDWQGEPAHRRVDRQIDFNWLEPPFPLPPPFSIEWHGSLLVDRAGLYGFSLESDDGSVLEIDGRVVVDNGGQHGVLTRRGEVELSEGTHELRLRYFNMIFGGMVRMLWEPPGGPVGPVPAERLSPLPEPAPDSSRTEVPDA